MKIRRKQNMFVEIKQTLRRNFGQILGWGLGLALYSTLMVSLYKDVSQIDLEALTDSYPEEIMAFFGESMEAFSSPWGYMDVYFFNYMTIIIGIFAVGASAKLLVKDEEEGILDLLISYPLSRAGFFWGRILGLLLTLIMILAIAWLSWVIPADRAGMDLSLLEFARPFFPLLGQLLLFGMLALFLSMVLPSIKIASMVSGGVLVANYLVVGLSNINENLQKVVEYTPLYYYQGGKAINGVNENWLLSILVVSLLFALLAWWLFEKRDLRVGGEGGWRLPTWLSFSGKG
jgi:ABC-2 type transport system permease protein